MIKTNKYLIGTSGWNYPDWRGAFYPQKLARKDWFAYYAEHFNVVEINATFYRFFKKEVFLKWRDQAKDNFKYIIKVNRDITHIHYLKDSKHLIKAFCKRVSLLEDKLALILLQLPPRMPYDPERLRKAISYFDDPTKLVVEFRHEKWLTPEVKEMLTEFGCTFCAADSPNMKLVDWVTSDQAYIRLHGRTVWFDYKYNRTQLNKIAEFAKKLTKKGAKKVYILFNNDYYAYAIENADYLKTILTVKQSINSRSKR